MQIPCGSSTTATAKANNRKRAGTLRKLGACRRELGPDPADAEAVISPGYSWKRSCQDENWLELLAIPFERKITENCRAAWELLPRRGSCLLVMQGWRNDVLSEQSLPGCRHKVAKEGSNV